MVEGQMPIENETSASISTGFRPERPAPRDNLGAEVSGFLRDALMSGRYPPGERLRVEDLASEMGVSTMPIREALLTLANEGLLVGKPRRGFRVAKLELQDVADVYSVHAYLAGRLAERAAAKISDEKIAELRELQSQLETAAAVDLVLSGVVDQMTAVEQFNYEFHRQINRSSDSSRLEWFVRAATRYIPRHFYQDIPAWTLASVEDHPAIIDALARHDGARARSLMEQHVERAGALVSEALEARGWPGAQQDE
jgi:DNA-binding GntR family transcriptional regulator